MGSGFFHDLSPNIVSLPLLLMVNSQPHHHHHQLPHSTNLCCSKLNIIGDRKRAWKLYCWNFEEENQGVEFKLKIFAHQTLYFHVKTLFLCITNALVKNSKNSGRNETHSYTYKLRSFQTMSNFCTGSYVLFWLWGKLRWSMNYVLLRLSLYDGRSIRIMNLPS